MIFKVLPGNETLVLIPAAEIDGIPYLLGATAVPFDAPTTAILNRYIPIVTPQSTNAGSGGNISCTVRDDMDLGPTDSGTDDDKTLCSRGASSELTTYAFDASISVFRDEDPLSRSSEFNMALELIRAADVPYIIAHRIGVPSTTLATVGEEWDFYYVWTDNPIPVYEDGGNQLLQQNFIAKNILNTGYALAS